MTINSVSVVINSQTIQLSNTGGNIWEANAVAPSISSWELPQRYYPIELTASTATASITKDDSDPTFGGDLRLRVKENVNPTIAIINPLQDSYVKNSGRIEFYIRDEGGSGIDVNSIICKIDNVAVVLDITSDFDLCVCIYNYSGLSDGRHTLYYRCTDNDGNETVLTYSITVDSIAPTTQLSNPQQNSITNNNQCLVSGVVSDTNLSTVTITVTNNSSVIYPTVNPTTGVFSDYITLYEGTNRVIIKIIDGAGNIEIIQRDVILDTHAPTVQSVILKPKYDSDSTRIEIIMVIN